MYSRVWESRESPMIPSRNINFRVSIQLVRKKTKNVWDMKIKRLISNGIYCFRSSTWLPESWHHRFSFSFPKPHPEKKQTNNEENWNGTLQDDKLLIHLASLPLRMFYISWTMILYHIFTPSFSWMLLNLQLWIKICCDRKQKDRRNTRKEEEFEFESIWIKINWKEWSGLLKYWNNIFDSWREKYSKWLWIFLCFKSKNNKNDYEKKRQMKRIYFRLEIKRKWVLTTINRMSKNTDDFCIFPKKKTKFC